MKSDNKMKGKTNLNRLGFYTAILMTLFTVAAFSIAICTPPISGPFCKGACISYPYTDIISRFPRDYIWMYPAIVLTIMFVILMVCIHYYFPENRKMFSLTGLCFAVISSMTLISDYFIQISVIQPSLINAETDGISLLTQYNPHGVFIALEEIGYLMMSVAFISLAAVFSGSTKLERMIKWVFIVSFILMIITFITISLKYGINREYRFEVAAITIDWTTLIIEGILLSILFRREMRNNLTLRWAMQNMSNI
jgi:hypothetical protein